jgi:hypothetical protein
MLEMVKVVAAAASIVDENLGDVISALGELDDELPNEKDRKMAGIWNGCCSSPAAAMKYYRLTNGGSSLHRGF